MKIMIDCSFIDFSKQPTGIPRVVTNYVCHAYDWARKNNVEVYPVVVSESGPYVVDPLPGRNHPEYLTNTIIESRIKGSNAVKRIPVLDGDLIFSPAYWHDINKDVFYNLKFMGAKIFTLVHDILPISHKKYYESPWREDVFLKNFEYAIDYSDRIYTVSGYTKDSIVDYCIRKNINQPEIHVAYNGLDELVRDDIARLIEDNKYKFLSGNTRAVKIIEQNESFIMVGSIEPKKGHIPVIDTFNELWKRGFNKSLIIIGRKGWHFIDVIKKIESSEYLNKYLFWFDSIDDLELYLAYKRSLGLIFSSVAEGFGLPMIEAASLGCPVIAFESEISREVVGDYASFFSNSAELSRQIIEHSMEKKSMPPKKWPSWSELVPQLFDKFINVS